MVKVVAFGGTGRRSLPGKYRLPLLDEGPDAFARILCPRDCGERMGLVFELAFQRSMGRLVKQALDRTKRLRGAHSEFLRYSRRLCLHGVVRDDEVRETERQRGPGIEGLAQKKKSSCARNADPARDRGRRRCRG